METLSGTFVKVSVTQPLTDVFRNNTGMILMR
jgi:hypothetical protein